MRNFGSESCHARGSYQLNPFVTYLGKIKFFRLSSVLAFFGRVRVIRDTVTCD